jgi:hypothetical protein
MQIRVANWRINAISSKSDVASSARITSIVCMLELREQQRLIEC